MITRQTNFSRRQFLQGASKALAMFPVLGMGLAELSSCIRQGNLLTSRASTEKSLVDVPWKIVMVSDQEPGEPLIISGTIYSPDGLKPMEGINLYVYQTDATGRYSVTGSGGDNRHTRLHGLMRTNDEGRYEFRTIKPAAYPRGGIPAHIHAYVSGPGYPEYWIDEYQFEGDPFLTEDQRQKQRQQGSFSSILTLTRGQDGVLRGVRDIRIERCVKNCTGR